MHTTRLKFTYARINSVLKDLSCDTPLPKILMLAILATYAITLNRKYLSALASRMIPYSHTEVCPYFTIDVRFSLLKIKKVFLRLVIGKSAKCF
ncbi:hypothetical protein H5410_057147 [Solanum commersonii]|uniref:Uncharacterized protein n=1 Tax=Solanum commersonii TaxID=4109 RepID=A0A9J5WNU9_SOLCO|nr:hypothetical protein H5410_057147 [Solanum commersonii]